MTDWRKLDFGETAFGARGELRAHLAWASFVALARRPWSVLLVDHTSERRPVRRGFALALAWMVSRRLRRMTSRERVGLVFPPGLGGYLANIAVVFAGKVPVNLNFTLGEASARYCIQRAEIDVVLTAEPVRARLPDFPWPETGVVDLVALLKALPKAATLGLAAAAWIVPAGWLARLLRVPRKGGDAEAALLFTSGSSGEPKGVVLTHRNILGNCAQVDAAGLLPPKEVLVANLPIFHSFGFTVTLWYPLVRGCGVVSVPSPLEVKKTADAIAAERATILIGTPTFLRAYLRKVAPEKLATVKYVVAGAEKTPDGFADTWERTFGGAYLEGYGLTETSPVVSVNLPRAPGAAVYPGDPSAGNRRGSVGRPLPGQTARILHPETREPLPVDETGLLALRGPHIFREYLGEPERTAEVKDGEWFVTGDLARFDADGFLFIEGRLSRFSKIGGEMVPHGTVEAALAEAFGVADAEAPAVAVSARPDEAKGEALVVLTTVPMDMESVRQRLSAAGFSNLWIPRQIRRVETIPTLASGKLDLRGIRELAAQAGEPEDSR